MTTNTPPVDVQVAKPAKPREDYLNCSKGIMSWLGTLDHKRIGLMYLIGVGVAFLCGGAFALLVRLHLWLGAHVEQPAERRAEDRGKPLALSERTVGEL